MLVAEFGWSYHMQGDGSKQHKAHEIADDFFKALQKPLADDFSRARPRRR